MHRRRESISVSCRCSESGGSRGSRMSGNEETAECIQEALIQ